MLRNALLWANIFVTVLSTISARMLWYRHTYDLSYVDEPAIFAIVGAVFGAAFFGLELYYWAVFSFLHKTPT